MMDLLSVLSKHTASMTGLGAPQPELDKDTLRRDLRACLARNERYFVTWTVVAVAIVALMATAPLWFRGSEAALGGLQGLLGASASTSVVMMLRESRRKQWAEVLIAMAAAGSTDAIKQIVLIAKRELSGKGAADAAPAPLRPPSASVD